MSVDEPCPYQVLAPIAQDAQGITYLAERYANSVRGFVALTVVVGGNGEAMLNVGTADGAAVCQKLLIFRESAGGQRDVIGEAEITEVTDKTSRAKLAADAKPVTPGLKALEKP